MGGRKEASNYKGNKNKSLSKGFVDILLKGFVNVYSTAAFFNLREDIYAESSF